MDQEFPPVFGIAYKWVAAVIVMIGTFMTLLDTTIVDITLPKMLSALNTDTYGIQWVVIAYMIGSAVAMTTVGWLGARTSYRFVYLVGFTLFVVTSALCGQSTNLEMMITARLIQGIGEGLVVPISMTYLFLVFPKSEAGLAMGIYGLGASFAPALGPTIGGFLTEHLNWRWIFYVNLPIGIIGLIMALALLKPLRPEEDRPWPFDWIGFLLLTTSLGSLITFISKGQEKGWIQSDFILILIAVFVLSTIAFLVWELRQKNPVIDIRLFKDPMFTTSVIGLCFFSLTLYSVYFLMPMYMERLRGYPTLLSGLLLLPGTMALGTALIIGGILTDKTSPRAVAVLCLIGLTAGSYLLGTMDLYTPKLAIIGLFAMWGIPAGPLFPAFITGGLSRLRSSQVNMGSSIQNVMRLVAGSVATSLAVTILERKADAYYVLFSMHTNPGHLPFLLGFERAVAGFQIKGSCLDMARVQAGALMNLYIKSHAYFVAYQATFKIMALLALGALPFMYLFKAGKGKRAAH